jgi:PAS domain S-box-containing protein
VLLTDEEADARTTSLAQQVLRSNAAVRWREMTLRSREGRTHAVTISAAPKRTADGELCGTVLVFHDIDAERQARRALRESEQHYRHFIELSPFAVFVQSDGRFVFVNDRAVALFGADSAQALLGSSVLERVHPDGRLLMSARMLNLREGRAQAAVEQRFLRFDGSAFDGESTAVPYEHQGRPAALVMLQDVSARREAELQLDRFFNLSLDLLCIADRNGRFKRVNQTFQDTLGTSEADLLERPFLDRVHPDDLAATRAAIASLVLGQPLREFSNRHRCEDGSWRWLAWTAVAHSDGFIYATARDVTEQRLIADKMGRLATELELRVAERSQALDALSAKQEEIRALVDNLPNGVITLDANGLIGSANPAMTRLFGFAQDELVGQSLASVVPEAGYMELNAFLDYHVLISRAGTMDIGRELAGRHKAGRELALEFGLGRYVVQGRHSYVATFSDISERKRLTIELTKARTAAEQSSRAKSSFLAAMSHEIRTPMNAVMGMAELLEHTKLSAKQSELVAPIRTSAAALLAIIDDILDFSKIEAGRMELERGSVSIGNTVEAVCMMLAPVASQRNVEVGLYVGSTIPARVMSDEVRLRQIIYNLVGNAVKFSGGRPDVRGRVKISVEDAVGRDNAVCLSVEDNGIGISAEAQAKLFSAFAQADITTTRRYGGTGLGLAICRRLVRLMGGTIEVRSALDTGSLFTVTLPVEIDADAPAETLPDLAGVECVLGTGSFDSASIARYLQEAGARLQVDAGDAALPPRAGTIHLDAGRDSGGRDGALGQSQLTITRIGAPASQAADVVTVYSGVICRRSLLEAVAHAAGRGDPPPGRADYAGHPISATCGPTVPQAEALGRLILVAEDDPINQKVILRQLELIGYAAEVVDNGIRALETWRTQRFALVLTDLQMPEMDGYALVVTIRNEEPVGTHTPVIALTANALSAEALRARAEGFDGYLTKPVQLATLKSELSRWLPPGCEAAISVPRASEREPAPTLDPGVLRALVGDDPVTLAQLYSDFVKLNRRAAADLGSAIAERNVEQVRFIAHRLKSSSLSVGALRLAETCLQLEQAARAGDSEAALAGGSAFEHAFASAETEIARLLGEFPTAATGP